MTVWKCIINIKSIMKHIDALRPMIFKVSIIISLALVLLLFNFSTPYINIAPPLDDVYRDETVKIIRTPGKEKKKEIPRKVSTKLTEKIIIDEVFSDPTTEELMDTIATEVEMDEGFGYGEAAPATILPEPPPPAPEEEDEPILFPDKMPIFGNCQGLDGPERQACSEKQLYEYLYANIDYPKIAVENGIEGRVVLRFVVGKDGSIRDLQVLRDIGAGCGEEAIRVVENMPAWTPGRQHNKPVSVIYTLPLKFELM